MGRAIDTKAIIVCVLATASIYTNNLSTAHRTASRIDVGYIWINAFTGPALGTP